MEKHMNQITETVKRVHEETKTVMESTDIDDMTKSRQLVILDIIDDIAARFIAHSDGIGYVDAQKKLLEEIK